MSPAPLLHARHVALRLLSTLSTAALLFAGNRLGAQTVSLLTGIPGENFAGVWGTGPTDLYATGGFQSLAHFDGTSWTAQNVSAWANRGRVFGDGNGTVYSAGQAGYQTGALLRSVSGGTWEAVLTVDTELIGLWVSAEGGVLASGDGRFFYSPDGVTFHEAPTGLSSAFNVDRLETVWGVSATDAYITGRGGLYRWDGTTFSKVDIPLPGMTAVHHSGTSWWTVGEQGAIWKGTNGTWTMLDAGVTSSLLGVWAFSDVDVWVAGDQGILRHFDGTSWTSYETGTTRPLITMFATDASTLYVPVGGGPGALLRIDIPPTVVPEPGTGALMGVGALCLLIALRRRRRFHPVKASTRA